MRASSPINSSRKIAKQAAPVNGRDKRLRAIDSRSLFRFSADKEGKHKLCLPSLISGWFLISQVYVFWTVCMASRFFHAHFFKILSSIFGKTRLSGFVGSRGGNKNLYGRSRAWVVRARFYRGAIIRCPLILPHRNLVGDCIPQTLLYPFGEKKNGWIAFVNSLWTFQNEGYGFCRFFLRWIVSKSNWKTCWMLINGIK